MAINFPQSLDTLTNPTGTELLENATAALDHAVQHSNANDGVEALQAKVGIDSSAVSTSHDYKLGDVATGDKAVSLTGTETLTNKTLTSPQIDFGSDAGGDLSIRSAGGVTERLGIGSTDQILTVAGGLPTWAANPAAASASTTVEGIVELATTAETTTGTDTTRAVTPDGLHDMTSLAGATWFLDEDTLATDSATKVASQQSIKAYVDSSNKFGTGTVTVAKNITTNITIPHGLGTTPALIRITCMGSPNTNVNSVSIGTGTSTSARQVVTMGTATGSGDESFVSSTAIISLRDSSSVVGFEADITTLDATNIVLDVPTNNNTGENRVIIWEAFA